MKHSHLASLALALALVPVAASALTVSNLSDGSLSGNTLTVTAAVDDVAASTTVTLWLGAAAPKDGDPANLLQAVDTQTITAGQTVTFDTHVVLGTKVAFKIAATDGTNSAESEVKTIVAPDGTKYAWNGPEGGYGLWSDPNNWSQGTDNGNRLGYPAYGSAFTFTKDYVMTARVDAAYNSDVFFQQVQNGSCFGWDNRQLVLVGITDDAEINIGGKTEHYPYSLVLDNIKVAVSEMNVNAGGYLKLLNGSSLTIIWWLGLQKDNAYCYVGPGCSITTTDWWEGTRIGGQNTLLEIDGGIVRTQRVLFGRDSSANVPRGILFRGATSRLFVEERMDIIRDDYSSSPVIEYVVPLGGYAAAPLQKSGNGNIPFAGTQDTANGKPIQFAINKFSPYFSGSQAADIPLLDWSNNGGSSAGIDIDTTDGCGISYGVFEDPANNRFYTDSNVNGVDATRLWVHLTGTSEPATKTLANSSASASVSDGILTVSASLREYDGGNGTSVAKLYVGSSSPTGDPVANMTLAATASLLDGNAFTISTPSPVTLGSKTAYAVVVENTQGTWFFTSSTVTNIVQVQDTANYTWVSGNSGAWSDPANWTCDQSTTGRLGYPSYGSKYYFTGSQTNVVYVDGNYSGLGNGYARNNASDITLTFRGTVPDAAIGQWSNPDNGSQRQNITFDAVALRAGNMRIYHDCTMNLINGATLTMTWDFNVNGRNAHLYVGSGALLRVSNGEIYHALTLSGTDSSIVIDNATIQARDIMIGANYTDQTPAGFFFRGAAPSLEVYGAYDDGHCIKNAIPGSPMFSFSVPVGGYAQAPIRSTGNTSFAFLAQSSESIPKALFRVERDSPFYAAGGNATAADVPLVSWNASGINVDGIAFSDSVGASSCRFFYTPDEAVVKTGLYAHLHSFNYTIILFR